jgi:transposase-like protein
MTLTEGSVTPTPAPIASSEIQSSPPQRKARSPRSILSEDQRREVVRLYAKTSTPLSEIKQQFGIAESSLYRLIQQRGVAPRGRRPVTTRSGSARRRTTSDGAAVGSRQSVRSRLSIPGRRTPLRSPSGGSGVEFRVTFAALLWRTSQSGSPVSN